MDISIASIVISLIAVEVIRLAFKLANKLWFRPRRVESYLKEQGFKGNSYRFFFGDMKDFEKMRAATVSKPMELSDDIAWRVLPYHHHIVKKYGKQAFIWFGTKPRLNIVDPKLIKEILARPNEFVKPSPDRMAQVLVGGLFVAEGEVWAMHKKIMNPAFHSDKLMDMIPTIKKCCGKFLNKWETLGSSSSSFEIDAWSGLEDLTRDIFYQTLMGRTYEEGRHIFELRDKMHELASKVVRLIAFRAWWYFPVKVVRDFKAVHRQIKGLVTEVVMERRKTLEIGEGNANKKGDLLTMIVESTLQEKEQKGSGLSIKEAIDECIMMHFIGSESTSRLLIWTLFILSKYPKWQERAREEVMHVFGDRSPNFDDLNNLKVVTMILYEVLRLYPPTSIIHRAITKETKLGDKTLPPWIQLSIPITVVNHSKEIWGDDVHEFKPERFSEGVSNFTSQAVFIAFALGPRTCIARNMAMVTVKLVVATILQHYSLELSPSYVHAPMHSFLLTPQFGVKLTLHKLK